MTPTMSVTHHNVVAFSGGRIGTVAGDIGCLCRTQFQLAF
jgi:hypothetical protein